MKQLVLLFILMSLKFASAQDTTYYSKSIPKPSTLSSHVFGIFISRIEADFRSQPDANFNIQLDFSSANVWGQPVDNFIAKTPELKNQEAKLPWHTREFSVDREDEAFLNNTDHFKIAYDGVIKNLKAKLHIPLNPKNALNIELRSFLLTDGRFPFTGLTGDDFIETFHSNIAGGEDPFQRREFGLNQNKIDYTDRNGRRMLIKDDLIFGGVKLNVQHYFTDFKPYGIHFSSGIHLGWNASSYNQSLDLGLSVNALKNFILDDKHYFQIGLGLGYLNLNTVAFSNKNIEFATRSYFFNTEAALTYNVVNSKQSTHSFGIDFYIQSAYNNPDEFDYSILFRNDKADRAWHHSASNLYKNNNYWTFFYAFTKKNSFRIYLQQDLFVNNNPDLQTGVGYVINF